MIGWDRDLQRQTVLIRTLSYLQAKAADTCKNALSGFAQL
jgi:hypothetical protein